MARAAPSSRMFAGAAPAAAGLVCLGAVAAAHGIRGEVKLKSFTEDPLAIGAYGPLRTETGAILKLGGLRLQGTAIIARIEGIADRNGAEALRGQRLYVPRTALPAPEDEDEFYHADLLGLAVVDQAGTNVGKVAGVQTFGGGDVLDIAFPDGGSAYLPFTREMVPVVDVPGGRVTIAPPEDWLDDARPGPDEPETDGETA